MAVLFSTGSQFAIASAYGTTIAVSAASNASECVITVADGTTFAVNDIIEFTSGWERANGRLFRIKAKSTNDLTLEGFNTTSTNNYPALSGTGSIREVTTWTGITNVRGVETQQPSNEFEDISTVSNAIIVEVPIAQRLGGIDFSVLADSVEPAYVQFVEAASDNAALTGLRIILPSGAKRYANGYFTYSKVETIPTRGAINNTISFRHGVVPTRYAT